MVESRALESAVREMVNVRENNKEPEELLVGRKRGGPGVRWLLNVIVSK